MTECLKDMLMNLEDILILKDMLMNLHFQLIETAKRIQCYWNLMMSLTMVLVCTVKSDSMKSFELLLDGKMEIFINYLAKSMLGERL